MGHVVVKYKVTINNPEEGSPDYQSIADIIDSFDEVQAVDVKPLAFGMMFIEDNNEIIFKKKPLDKKH